MKTYQTQASYNRHKCCYCSKCGQLYSSFQKFQLHKCKVKEVPSAHSLTATKDGAEKPASSHAWTKDGAEKPASSHTWTKDGAEKPASSHTWTKDGAEKPASSHTWTKDGAEKPASSHIWTKDGAEKPASSHTWTKDGAEKPASSHTWTKDGAEKPASSHTWTKKTVVCNKCMKTYQSQVLYNKHKCCYCSKCEQIYSSFQKFRLHKCKIKEITSASFSTVTDNWGKKLASSSTAPASSIVMIDDARSVSRGISHADAVFSFHPVMRTWQADKCKIFNLQIQKSHSLGTKEALLSPCSLKTVIGDGNCFYRCISYCVTGSQDFHLNIRQKLVSHMRVNRDVMRTLIPGGAGVLDYIKQKKLGQPGTWATEVEIHAMANMLQTDIYTYTMYGSSWKWLKCSSSFLNVHDDTDNRPALYQQNTNLNHYDVVEDVHNKSVVPVEDKSIERLKEYFTSQSQMVSKQTDSGSSQTSRAEYFRNYKRLQRQDKNFRQNEAMKDKTQRWQAR